MSTRIFEGQVTVPEGARFVVVASRFNHFIVDRLVDGALDAIARHGGTSVEGAKLAEVSVVRVPGAWEIPWAVARIARPQPTNLAIIALGAVIRGSTPHFDHISAEATKGIAHASFELDVPMAYGVLTCDTIEQAIERAGTKAGNKGWEAALSAIELLNLGAALFKQGL